MPTTVRHTALLGIQAFRNQQILPSFITFAGYLLAAKLGQYIFFTFDTSPAVVLAPAGVGLAAVLLGGYRMWFPIALAHIVTALTSPASHPFAVIALSTLGNTLQPLVGAYAMRYFGFTGKFNNVRDPLLLIGAGIFITMLGPAFSYSGQWLAGTLSDNWITTWGRAWGGGMLSVLVITALVVSWYPYKNSNAILNQKETLSLSFSFGMFILISVITFWLPVGQWGVSLLAIYAYLATLFWIALQHEPRVMTAAIFASTVIGVLGSILVDVNPANTLAAQLFAVQMFIVLMGAIFLPFAGVAEERRKAVRELKAYTDQLRSSLHKMGSADKAKNEFIAILAHELRNPLAPVMSTLEILKLKNHDDESRQLIESAEQQTHSMRRLLDDLLDVARVTQQKFKLQQEHISAQTILRRAVSSTEVFIKSRGHALHTKFPEENLALYADPVRLEQIVVNLLNNAAKYTERGGHIRLSAWPENEALMIKVEDDGIGIPAERLEDIFEPFRQISAAPRVGTGLGIGLALTKRLVEMHQGRIEAASSGPGRGSSFTVRIPLAVATTVEQPVSPQFTSRSLQPTASRILVIDDNEPAAQGLKRLLEMRGHEVRTAYTGQQGLDTLTAYTPDLILLDIGLPDMNGYEVAEHIRTHMEGGGPTLVALTGYGQDEDKAMAHNAGFNYHLTKPVSLRELEGLLYRITSEPAAA
ncbi:MAG: response regulator [Candidatus Pacebacteria bacterium]|nr:response regulator [Candidatus Paceibacterota bacterium]